MNTVDALNELDEHNTEVGLVCEDCLDCPSDSKLRFCPYQSDLNNRKVEVVLCDQCASDRAREL